MTIQLVHRRPVAVDSLKTIWTGGKSRSYESRMAKAEHENFLRQVFCSGCGVIGGEDLCGRYLLIDYACRQIVATDEACVLENAKTVPLECDTKGRPVITIENSAGSRLRLLLDTGAGLTFAGYEGCECGDVLRYREPDFVSERIEGARTRHNRFKFCGEEVEVEIGEPNERRVESLKKHLGDSSLNGVIGYDFFVNFTVLMDRLGGRIYYRRVTDRKRYHYFVELHAPYYDVWAKKVKKTDVDAYLKEKLPDWYDEDNPPFDDNDWLAGGYDLKYGRLKVMAEGGEVLFEHDSQPVGDRAFINFHKFRLGSVKQTGYAEDEIPVYTTCEAKCDGAGVELWTDDPFDPTKFSIGYEDFTDGQKVCHTIMRDMDYDGQLLDFEDIDGGYGEKFSRFV